MAERIYYLRQASKRVSGFMAAPSGLVEQSLVVHYYVLAEDDSNAGGAAGSFALEHGLECTEYICLPQPISREQIAQHESEHLAAFQLAQERGFAVVVASVLAWPT